MQTGVVKWFNDQKGFGFISQRNGGPDVFVHQSVIRMPGRRTLVENQEVEYESERGQKGLQASVVIPLTSRG